MYTKLSIESRSSDGKSVESSVEVEGKTRDILNAWCMLTYSLAKKLDIPPYILLALFNGEKARSSITELTEIDLTSMGMSAK